MIIGFTAARDTDLVPLSQWLKWLEFVPDCAGYVTGGARGGDRIIGERMWKIHPTSEHWVILPGNGSQLERWWEDPKIARSDNLHIVQLPLTSPYRTRNLYIVEKSDELEAFPAYPENDLKSKRSGTWQTVRLARKKGIPIRTHILRP